MNTTAIKSRIYQCLMHGSAAIMLTFMTVDKASADSIATQTTHPTGIHWHPKSSFAQMTLTVSGPDGLIIQKKFESNETPAINIYSDNDGPLPDGSYTYELSLVPNIDEETKAALARARESGDYTEVQLLRASGKLPSGRRGEGSQSGYFTIVNGEIMQEGQQED